MKWLSVAIAIALCWAASPRAAAQPPATAATVAFRNDLPATYELRSVRLWVDGMLIHEDSGPFDAPIAPGTHVVSIAAEYQMRDPLLPYVRGYVIKLRSAEHIRSEPAHVIAARAQESGGVTTPIERRARIAWR
ncbi:MAG: hypothetical protein WBY94_04950 [Polyangiaceae bacterium]